MCLQWWVGLMWFGVTEVMGVTDEWGCKANIK